MILIIDDDSAIRSSLSFMLKRAGVEIAPTAEDVAGFDKYIETYKAGLAIEKAAVENKK